MPRDDEFNIGLSIGSAIGGGLGKALFPSPEEKREKERHEKEKEEQAKLEELRKGTSKKLEESIKPGLSPEAQLEINGKIEALKSAKTPESLSVLLSDIQELKNADAVGKSIKELRELNTDSAQPFNSSPLDALVEKNYKNIGLRNEVEKNALGERDFKKFQETSNLERLNFLTKGKLSPEMAKRLNDFGGIESVKSFNTSYGSENLSFKNGLAFALQTGRMTPQDALEITQQPSDETRQGLFAAKFQGQLKSDIEFPFETEEKRKAAAFTSTEALKAKQLEKVTAIKKESDTELKIKEKRLELLESRAGKSLRPALDLGINRVSKLGFSSEQLDEVINVLNTSDSKHPVPKPVQKKIDSITSVFAGDLRRRGIKPLEAFSIRSPGSLETLSPELRQATEKTLNIEILRAIRDEMSLRREAPSLVDERQQTETPELKLLKSIGMTIEQIERFKQLSPEAQQAFLKPFKTKK